MKPSEKDVDPVPDSDIRDSWRNAGLVRRLKQIKDVYGAFLTVLLIAPAVMAFWLLAILTHPFLSLALLLLSITILQKHREKEDRDRSYPVT